MRAEDGGRMVGAVRQQSESEEEEWMAELMDSAVGGLCTPLKVSPSSAGLRNIVRTSGSESGAADNTIAGKQHHVLQNRKSVAILYVDHAAHSRRDGCTVQGSSGVSPYVYIPDIGAYDVPLARQILHTVSSTKLSVRKVARSQESLL